MTINDLELSTQQTQLLTELYQRLVPEEYRSSHTEDAFVQTFEMGEIFGRLKCKAKLKGDKETLYSLLAVFNMERENRLDACKKVIKLESELRKVRGTNDQER